MRVEKANRRSTRFLVAGSAVLILKVALGLVGIDLPQVPLEVTGVCLLMASTYWSGWVRGHREAG